MTGPPLLTDRLLLRDFVEDDWRAVHEYDADPDVVYFMTWGPNSEQDSRDFVGRNITASRTTPRTDFELAVVCHREYGAPKGGSHPGSVIRRCRQVPGGSSQRLDNNLTPEVYHTPQSPPGGP